MAQAVERWHSVRASRVQIPGRTWLFFGRMLSIYSRWALGYIFRKLVIESATYSSFFFPVSYHLRIVNISIALYQRKKINPQKEAGKGPYLKKVGNPGEQAPQIDEDTLSISPWPLGHPNKELY